MYLKNYIILDNLKEYHEQFTRYPLKTKLTIRKMFVIINI